jgi:hypothetical protein
MCKEQSARCDIFGRFVPAQETPAAAAAMQHHTRNRFLFIPLPSGHPDTSLYTGGPLQKDKFFKQQK